ncbi:hypothetical protein STEG23_010639 [Scotinomys teguina]
MWEDPDEAKNIELSYCDGFILLKPYHERSHCSIQQLTMGSDWITEKQGPNVNTELLKASKSRANSGLTLNNEGLLHYGIQRKNVVLWILMAATVPKACSIELFEELNSGENLEIANASPDHAIANEEEKNYSSANITGLPSGIKRYCQCCDILHTQSASIRKTEIQTVKWTEEPAEEPMDPFKGGKV